MATSFQTSQVEQIVQQGWRRRLLVLAVAESAIALALVFAGFALLIVLGTQILAWPWLLALAAVGIGLSYFGVRRRLSDQYTVAQMMDQHLALNDSLSTAWFLRTNRQAQDQTAAAYQLHRAEQLAQTADPAAAFPFQRQRSWLITGALGLLALGLFSARYLVTRELSLQHSFLPLAVTQVFENVRHSVTDVLHNEQATDSGKAKGLPPAAQGKDAERQPPAAKPEQGQPPGQQQAKGGDAKGKNNESPDQDAEQAKSAEGKAGEAKRNGDGQGEKSGANAEAANKPPSESGQQPDAKQQDGGSQQRSASMMDRMRDAVSSVMSKLKPSGNQQESQSGAQKNADGQKGADQSASKDQNGEGQKESGKEQSAQEQSSGQQQGQGAAKAQAAGKDSAQASDKKGSDAQSGVGHSDGDKDVKAAEQAKAMGKLAEIIGKRSASLTGDMQIEPSGKQRLQTGYTHQQGQHADLGGEINRDEVPVEDQEYVREYMELVRKKPLKGTTSP
jgi:hypothetical protein